MLGINGCTMGAGLLGLKYTHFILCVCNRDPICLHLSRECRSKFVLLVPTHAHAAGAHFLAELLDSYSSPFPSLLWRAIMIYGCSRAAWPPFCIEHRHFLCVILTYWATIQLECVRQPVSKKTEFPATEVLQVCDLGLGLDRDIYIHFAEHPKI